MKAPARRSDLFARTARERAERKRASLIRCVRTVEAIDGAHIVVGGRRLLNFASNDYLGLAQHPALREALILAARTWGVGATAAHLLGGHREEHAALEAALARWTGRESALLFSDGWTANLGVVSALLGADDISVQDKLNHASLIDAARFAGCELARYRHLDVDGAARQLDARPGGAAILATDGVFSMDGDVAPLGALADVARSRGATLMVDDAHGLGVLGREGAGSIVEAGLSEDDAPILMATLGKALGVAGAFVAGRAALIDALVQNARTYIYATAMPPALAAAARVAIDIARFEDWRRDRIARLVAHFRTAARDAGWTLTSSRTPIQPVVVGSSEKALSVAAALENAGLYAPAIRPPTVREGEARIRVTLTALHAERDVDRLVDALSGALKGS
jgi:8-amino-7-oxononanoate synthase